MPVLGPECPRMTCHPLRSVPNSLAQNTSRDCGSLWNVALMPSCILSSWAARSTPVNWENVPPEGPSDPDILHSDSAMSAILWTFKKCLLIDFREREREGEKHQCEKHRSVASGMCNPGIRLDQGLNL